MKILLSLVVGLFLLVGCDPEATEPQAEQITISELMTTPGYAWFPAEVATYKPNAAVVDSIRSRFSKTEHKVCIFVKPTCACRGTQRLFPRVIRALQDANVDMSRVEIWSMRSEADIHPYMSSLNVVDLPTIFVLRNGELRTKIQDASFNDQNADSLIAEALLQ